MIAVQKSCMHASAVAVFVEWWIVVFVDNVSFHRGICTLGASFTRIFYFSRRACHFYSFVASINSLEVVLSMNLYTTADNSS